MSQPSRDAATIAELRQTMRFQLPVVRTQIRSLRAQARATAALAHDDPGADLAGHILTSVMLAGFALELGLKQFYMAFCESRPHGHNLQALYDGLPDQMRAGISAAYASAEPPTEPIMAFGLRISEQQPETPSPTPASDFDTAEGVIAGASSAFIKSRYFFEETGTSTWATIETAVPHMTLLSEVLDTVLDGYRKTGWSGS